MASVFASLTAPYQSGSNWFRVHEDGISFPPARSGRETKGPRPLMAMCIRLLADNINAAPRASIKCLPERVKWAMWKELHPRSMPLHVWHILAPSLLEEEYQNATGCLNSKEWLGKGVTLPMALYRYCQEIVDPPCPLSIYITPLQHLEDCLVRLCIDKVDRYETHELIPLARLPRLAVLELVEHSRTRQVITDHLIRGWSEVGKQGQVFPSLRVLQIATHNNTCALAANSLHYILRFPALEVLDTFFNKKRRRDAKDIAASYGWNVTKPNTKGALFVAYAEPYLDGLVEVKMRDFWKLRDAFKDDRQQVTLVDISIKEGRGSDASPSAGPPPTTGAAEFPEGEENCLMGKWFVFTGLLKTLSREEACLLVERYGGKVTGVPSRKTDFAVVGSDAGPSKLREIKEHSIETIDEEGLFHLIRTMPAHGGVGMRAKQPPKSVKQSDGSNLDDGWRSLLQGTHLCATTEADAEDQFDLFSKCPLNMTEDQAFWLLGLLDQKNRDAASSIQAQVEGVTLPREPFVSLMLRDSCHLTIQPGTWLHERSIFTRRRVSPASPNKERNRKPQTSRIPRQDNRKVTECRPRKRQRTAADLLSSFGTSSGKLR
ncbi:hypothetical protein N657DRAFT_690096 [Parathielavia appendiculata]|uniref:BRCT domain-containing protein n=1 Tax=Parathielavia appendiculata TaxID=2587402 RepID=A0AAN6Z464_9PEZI|nr:hypothetical protein N657DRAFT_690096 [Parathielavia appendiculata]